MSSHVIRTCAFGLVALASALSPTLVPTVAYAHGTQNPDLKNAISRGPLSTGTSDPTTSAQATAANDAAKAQRAEADPTLIATKAATYRPHASTPEDIYAMSRGCYVLKSRSNGKWVARTSSGYVANRATSNGGERFWFQATDLGSYLLWDAHKRFLNSTGAMAGQSTTPAATTEWKAAKASNGFIFTAPSGRTLGTNAAGAVVTNAKSTFALQKATGCGTWPEVSVNVSGAAFGGKTSYQEVRGYVDAHTHGMAFEFLGGDVHCGRPWHKYGVAYALQDCADHKLLNGAGAILENFMRNGLPVGTHDPVGWPSFKDWPAPDSLTHEGTYWKWLERSWRGGQRILVNLLVQNNKLCEIYPIKHNSCDDMDMVRLEAKDMRDMERYIDAQYGGPGRGFYRIVTDPFQARKVVNSGRMAVVMGIETSVIFGCTMTLDRPACDESDIDENLDEVYRLGVRQMELVNKFDNALAGVAGDSGAIAPLVNAANFLETGSFWDMRACPGSDPEVSDHSQLTALPAGVPAQDELFGAVTKLFGTLHTALPIYQAGPTCNTRGLTDLGKYTIEQMAKRRMIFDPDHMSVKARQESLDLVESMKYPGVVSSHSWATPDAYPRIYKDGGFITPYAGDSAGFVTKWQRHLTWVDPRFYWGIGYGADINGLGAQGNPRGADAKNPVKYPFKGLGGVTIEKQVSGTRTYDINVDGVSHYGLYPDWIEDLRRQAGPEIADDMARGSEAYLQMWERASGAGNDACRQSTVRKPTSTILHLKHGSSTTEVLKKVGIPHQRLGSSFVYCTKSSTGSTQRVRVSFTASGRLSSTTRI